MYKNFFNKNDYYINWGSYKNNFPIDFVVIDNKNYLIIGSKICNSLVYIGLDIRYPNPDPNLILPSSLKKIISLKLEKLEVLSTWGTKILLKSVCRYPSITIPNKVVSSSIIRHITKLSPKSINLNKNTYTKDYHCLKVKIIKRRK